MNIWSIPESFVRKVKILYFKIKYKDNVEFKGIIKFRAGFKIVIDDNGKAIFGNRCFFNNYCSINCKNSIVIGDCCIFGENVKIYDHNHCYADESIPIADQGFKTRPVHIGNNCWIGSNCVILPGVTIGDHCVIGAGCIIYKDIPSGELVTCGSGLNIRKIDLGAK